MKIIIKDVPTEFLVKLAEYIESREDHFKTIKIGDILHNRHCFAILHGQEMYHISYYRTKTAINFRGE